MRVCVTTTSCNLTKERKGNTATQPHITAKMDRTLEPSNKSINDRGRLASLSRGFYPSIVNNLRLRVEGLKLAGCRLMRSAYLLRPCPRHVGTACRLPIGRLDCRQQTDGRSREQLFFSRKYEAVTAHSRPSGSTLFMARTASATSLRSSFKRGSPTAGLSSGAGTRRRCNY
jgi:hypothetical protein